MLSASRVGILLFLSALVGRAFGGISVTDQNRSIQITAQGNQTTTLTADPFQPFNSTLNINTVFKNRSEYAFAQQTSSLTASDHFLDITVNGQFQFQVGDPTDNPFGSDNVGAAVNATLTFTIDAPATFHLTQQSNFQTFGAGDESSLYGASLYKDAPFDGPNLLSAYNLVGQSKPDPVIGTGVLSPGVYFYSFAGIGNDSAPDGMPLATFSSDFQIAVPEPASVSLVVGGVGSLLLMRRRNGY